MLRDRFLQLCGSYTTDTLLAEELWVEIEQRYSAQNRHYHTLVHLRNLLNELDSIWQDIAGKRSVLFALFYHDIVYSATASDNEERSAELATERMKKLGVDRNTIQHCNDIILATKGHGLSGDNDTDMFTDADLSILGADASAYAAYAAQVRQEYSIYPDLLYRPGRKKVLKHFLNMEHIFKTTHFRSLYEKQARLNLQMEIE